MFKTNSISRLKIAALSLGLFGALLAPQCSADSAPAPLVIPAWLPTQISTQVQTLAVQKKPMPSLTQISAINTTVLEKVLAEYGNDVSKIPSAATPYIYNLIQGYAQAAL